MKSIDDDLVVCFDVDDTLIAYKGKDLGVKHGKFIQHVTPIQINIEALKRHKCYGQTVIVWSRSGHKWAEAVVRALRIEDYVDYCMTKPLFYYDDIPAEKWMGEPRWGGDRR